MYVLAVLLCGFRASGALHEPTAIDALTQTELETAVFAPEQTSSYNTPKKQMRLDIRQALKGTRAASVDVPDRRTRA